VRFHLYQLAGLLWLGRWVVSFFEADSHDEEVEP
jgi:hypothetical protein